MGVFVISLFSPSSSSSSFLMDGQRHRLAPARNIAPSLVRPQGPPTPAPTPRHRRCHAHARRPGHSHISPRASLAFIDTSPHVSSLGGWPSSSPWSPPQVAHARYSSASDAHRTAAPPARRIGRLHSCREPLYRRLARACYPHLPLHGHDRGRRKGTRPSLVFKVRGYP